MRRQRWRGTSREMVSAARRLRGEMTPAEKVLWDALRLGRCAGLRFRRQHAVGTYVLDFFCLTEGLAIELDGAVHDATEQQERDAARTEWLASQGYRVLRFRNEAVLSDLDGVLTAIRTSCIDPLLPPTPSCPFDLYG